MCYLWISIVRLRKQILKDNGSIVRRIGADEEVALGTNMNGYYYTGL